MLRTLRGKASEEVRIADCRRLALAQALKLKLKQRISKLTRSRNFANKPHTVSTYLSAKHRFLRDTTLTSTSLDMQG